MIYLKYFLGIVLIFLCCKEFSIAQVSVTHNRLNVVYTDIENDISIATFDYQCDDVQLESSQGKLIKKECGKYLFTTDKLGEVVFTLYTISGSEKQKIAEVLYRVKNLQLPIACIGDCIYKDLISIEYFKKQNELKTYVESLYIDPNIKIVSFTYSFKNNNGNLLYSATNIGAKFDANFNEYKNKLRINEQIKLSNIICIDQYGKKRELNPIEYTLVP